MLSEVHTRVILIQVGDPLIDVVQALHFTEQGNRLRQVV